MSNSRKPNRYKIERVWKNGYRRFQALPLKDSEKEQDDNPEKYNNQEAIIMPVPAEMPAHATEEQKTWRKNYVAPAPQSMETEQKPVSKPKTNKFCCGC